LIRAALVLLPLGVALTATSALAAPPISLVNVQSTILDTGLNFPTGMAVNRTGDVFIADSLNNRVLKVSSTGAQSTAASGLKLPQGVAVDGAGNLFVADTYNDRILKVSPAGVQTSLGSGLNRPQGVAVDGAGNLFIADAFNSRVLKLAPGGAQTVVGGGLSKPAGVAVDGAGNVIIADTGNNRVVKVSPSGALTVVSSLVTQPYGVAADGAGNVFIADTNSYRVIKVAPNGAQSGVGSGFDHPYGVAVDSAGSVFIADSNHDRVIELQLSAINFGNLNVCPAGAPSSDACSRTLTLNYHIEYEVTLGTPAVLTQGAPDLDFKLAGGTCTGIFAAGASCTVNVTFAPLAPGVRMGGVQFTDSRDKLLTSTPVYGQGQGPAIAFGAGAQTTLAIGVNSPSGVAVDAAGNVFVVDFLGSRVLKVSPSGVQTGVGVGLRFPNTVAVDGGGNVFIADSGNNRVVRVSPDGTQTLVGTGLKLPQGVAVDGAGNVFIADYSNNRVVKIAAASGLQMVVGSGLSFPYSVAVDGSGNIYIADYGNDRVVKVSAMGVQSPVASGLNHPTAVAVDAAGSVLIADTFNNRVLEVSIAGPQTTLVGELNRPQGVAMDGAGNLFIADSGNNRVVQVQRSSPSALTFPLTYVGQSSTRTATIQNIGNQRLNAVAPGLTIGTNYQLAGGNSPADCNARFALAPGTSCDLDISFTPKAPGSFQSTVVLTDNSLNGAPATQTLNLSGTSMLQAIATVNAASAQYSDPVTLTAVVGPAGLSFAGSLQFQVGGAPVCSVPVTGSGTYSCTYTVTQGLGSYSLAAILSSSDSSVHGSTGISTLTVHTEQVTIVPSAAATITAAPGPSRIPITLTATLQQAADGSLGDIDKAYVAVVVTGDSRGTITCQVVTTAGAVTASCPLLYTGTYLVAWTVGGNYFQGQGALTTLTLTK